MGEVCVEIVQDNTVLLPPGGSAVVLVSTMPTGEKSIQRLTLLQTKTCYILSECNEGRKTLLI